MPAPLGGLFLAGIVVGAGAAIGSKLAKKIIIPKSRELWIDLRESFNQWSPTGGSVRDRFRPSRGRASANDDLIEPLVRPGAEATGSGSATSLSGDSAGEPVGPMDAGGDSGPRR